MVCPQNGTAVLIRLRLLTGCRKLKGANPAGVITVQQRWTHSKRPSGFEAIRGRDNTRQNRIATKKKILGEGISVGHFFQYVTVLIVKDRDSSRPCHPFRTAVPFWRQPTQIPSNLSSKRDCGSKRVKR